MGVRPRNQCECSGTLNLQESNESFSSNFTANICPSCQLTGSTYSFMFTFMFDTQETFTFNATKINKPECRTTQGGLVLNVTGYGTFTSGTATIQDAPFALSLIEFTDGTGSIAGYAGGFDENGVHHSFTFVNGGVPDDSISVTSCNPFSTTSLGSSLPFANVSENGNKGSIIIVRNGKVEKFEF